MTQKSIELNGLTLAEAAELLSDPSEQVEYLTPKEAAEFIGYAAVTLARWRVEGFGPRFCGARRIRYEKVDLIDWMDSTKRWSTSEEGAV
jgi:helix-turn-helix protein